MVTNIRQHARPIAVFLFFVTLIFLLSRAVVPANERMVRGFAAYYTASVLLAQGKLGPQSYNNQWFTEQVHAEVDQSVDEILAPTLPTVSLVAMPLIFMPPQAARDVWTWLNFFVLLAALGLLTAVFRQPDQAQQPAPRWLTLAALAFMFPPVAANFHEDQAIILFFCLFVIALWSLIKGQDWLAGTALGLAFILKTTGFSLWLLLLVHRRWKAVAWGGIAVVAVLALSLPWIGLDTWQAYLRAVGDVTNSPIRAVTAYQTTAGFFTHLFHFDPVWNPAPVSHQPALAFILTTSITLLALAVTIWHGRKASVLTFFAALVPLSVILLPVAEEHHFIVMLISIFVLVDNLLKFPRKGGFYRLEWLLLSSAIILLVSPIPYENSGLSAGWPALLAYPRLYGGWLIWLVAVWRMSAERLQLEAAPGHISTFVPETQAG